MLLGILLLVLILLGLFGRSIDARHVELDLATQPDARPMLLIVCLTMAIAMVVSYATGSAFASRYLAILAPLIFLAVALGLTRLGSGLAFRLVAALLVLLGLLGGGRNVVTARTQARQVADAIEADLGPDDLVICCPDQLGPALIRELPPDTDVVAYPDFSRPLRIDWVDYTDRLDAADPTAFGKDALERAGTGRHLVRLVGLVPDPRGHLRAGAELDAPGPPERHQPGRRRRRGVLRARGPLAPPRPLRAAPPRPARRSWPG